MTLALKLLLAPSFVALVSLAVRRYGPVVGGLLGGLPVVAGPILLVITLDHGRRFGADSATGTVVGLVALGAFVLVYARACGRCSPLVSMLLGWAGFGAVAACLSFVDPGPLPALAVTWAAFALQRRAMPQVVAEEAVPIDLPSWDLPVRAVAAGAMVVALTAASDTLGPEWSGLLAPFPIITTVLAVFTHAHHGPMEARILLRGLLNGLFAFALFADVLALTLRPWGTAIAFAAALSCCLALLSAIAWRTAPRQPSAAGAMPSSA